MRYFTLFPVLLQIIGAYGGDIDAEIKQCVDKIKKRRDLTVISTGFDAKYGLNTGPELAAFEEVVKLVTIASKILERNNFKLKTAGLVDSIVVYDDKVDTADLETKDFKKTIIDCTASIVANAAQRAIADTCASEFKIKGGGIVHNTLGTSYGDKLNLNTKPESAHFAKYMEALASKILTHMSGEAKESLGLRIAFNMPQNVTFESKGVVTSTATAQEIPDSSPEVQEFEESISELLKMLQKNVPRIPPNNTPPSSYRNDYVKHQAIIEEIGDTNPVFSPNIVSESPMIPVGESSTKTGGRSPTEGEEAIEFRGNDIEVQSFTYPEFQNSLPFIALLISVMFLNLF